MKKAIFVIAGLVAAGAAYLLMRTGSARQMVGNLLDLNSASHSDLLALGHGLSGEHAEAIIENRPYFSKIDLISRRIVPDGVYELIKHSVATNRAA